MRERARRSADLTRACDQPGYDYDYDLLQVHVVIPLATCLRNGYAIPLGYAEFPVLKEMWVKKMGLLRVS